MRADPTPPERFRVVGGARLAGEVRVTGAKNSVLKTMAAALLAEGRTTLTDVPRIYDVEVMSELLRRLGCEVDYDVEAATVVIDVPAVIGHQADYDLVRRIRASICVLGPLIARCGEAEVAMPGGDQIGSRPLDFHIAGLTKLGAELESEHGYIIAKAPQGLTGATVWLDFPSVGATENVLMAVGARPAAPPSSTTRRASPRSSTSCRCSSRWAPRSTAAARRR